MGDKGLDLLVNGMKVYSNIISLNINDNNLTEASIPALGDYMTNNSFIELRMSGNSIGNKGIKSLSKCF